MGNIESTAVLTTDKIITWKQKEHRINCQCRLRIYQLDFDRVVVIASSRSDYPGASNLREVKRLIHQVCYDFGIPIGKTMWIEHYPANHPEGLEFYYQVLFLWDEVCWYKIGQHQLEWLLGQRI